MSDFTEEVDFLMSTGMSQEEAVKKAIEKIKFRVSPVTKIRRYNETNPDKRRK